MRPALLSLLALCALPCCLLKAQVSADVPPQAGRVRAPAPPPAPPPVPTGRIAGTVFCADTHKPARGAVLVLEAKPGQRTGNNSESIARVAMDGSYTFPRVAPGEYVVIGVLPGYLSAFDGLQTSQDGPDMEKRMWEEQAHRGLATVRSGALEHLDIELERGASITGRVLYSDGAPATQISIETQDVNAKPPSSDPSNMQLDVGVMMRTMFTHQSNATDDQGRFRISGLRPGKYYIVAIQPSSSPSSDLDGPSGMAAIVGFGMDPLAIRIYAGDTVHRAAAKTFELRAGDDISGIDITIPIAAFHAVKGKLSAVDGRPLNIADLTLTDPADSSFSLQTRLQRDGTFDFPSVPAGTYTLTSKNARIGELNSKLPPEYAANSDLIPKTAFGDSTQPVVVAESDVTDLNITLTEVPMPKPDPANSPQVPITTD